MAAYPVLPSCPMYTSLQRSTAQLALNTTKARRLAISQKILGLPVIAVYENGEMIDSCVKDDATPENVEAMIKKYA